jgi:hypothetical protein
MAVALMALPPGNLLRYLDEWFSAGRGGWIVAIATPLGRLDSAHRNNLVEKYFPQASHQVILLSTDTETRQQFSFWEFPVRPELVEG